MSNEQENKIKETAVAELLGKNFFIPGYQRGYRWTEQQVNDLLNDIKEFKSENNSWYCLQPLVVMKKDGKDEKWEVIDGQQRLTTIYLILACLGVTDKYTIEYETREGSEGFLKDISKKIEDEAQSNIDFFYMHKAYKTIEKFFEKEDKEQFEKKLLNNVKFIRYEIDKGENPVTVFTRLNMGKIPLTNAELIKALFLNRSNFGAGEGKNETLRLRQQEMASEWDTVEYTLQNDEFWLFLNQPGDNRPTRIDFIFDLICKQDVLKVGTDNTGTDEYRTFRYFYKYFQTENADIVFCWKTVKKYFQIFQEWYNDLELYHYVGYLIICDNDNKSNSDSNSKKNNILDYLEEWVSKKTREEFITGIKGKIKESLKNCLDLNKEYETQGNPKTKCRPLLLLHNIQIVINQNKQMENSKYGMATFYKFPFHLFKLEKWDVEHIDSNTENDLSDIKEQKEWLKSASLTVTDAQLKENISNFITKEEQNSENNQDIDFKDLKGKIIGQDNAQNRLSDSEKNMVWNFTLLDSNTNRSYGNAIFPVKRRIIIGKDQGIRYEVGKNLEVTETTGNIAFIPPVTKNIFFKYYNPNVNNLKEWTREDAKAYKNSILKTLKEFGVKDSRSENNEYNK